MRILVIEDDPALGDGLARALRQHGYTPQWLTRGDEALTALSTETFDAIILDLGLPKLDGLDVLRRARKLGITTPVLVLTARDSLESKLDGLDSGADDYLLKPFDLPELLARLRAICRRSMGRTQQAIEYGDLLLDTSSQRVEFRGEPVSLSRTEYQLLHYLLEHAGKVVTRSQLEALLYGWDGGVESNALEVHIHNLRRKIHRELIRTLRGVGYMIPRQPPSWEP
ncbi:MAG: response regulator transcription factor [Gammaproteobacteria bacterium]|jgi:two-component system response regulator QseB|nr:response regulator transcription factor [Gammaproteobacteria bacterium]